MRSLFLLLLCAAPLQAGAAVVVSEVAWMGTAVSPNDEWIELHNTGGSPVSVDGWILKDAASLEIALSGTIAAGDYAVLERTDDATAAGTAFLIYAGALANTGSTLSLYTADAALEDQVAGGENWENIGGDNVTKETAQHTSSGWKTAEATPGRGLTASEIPEEEENEEEEESEAVTAEPEEEDSKDGDHKVIEMKLPNATLSLSLLAPDIVYVHQPVSFDAVPSGIGETLLNSLAYEWNYGDFTTQSGRIGKHIYDHPGEYVVTVHAQYGRHAQVARKTIKVLPVNFVLTLDTKGNILLHNDAKYEVNISGYTLSGSEKMVFPERSVILNGGTIAIPKAKVSNGTSMQPVILYDQEGEKVASTESLIASPFASFRTFLNDVYEAPIAEASDSIIEDQKTEESSNFSFSDEVSEGGTEQLKTQPADAEPQATLDNEGRTATFPKEALPLLGLFGIVTLGLIAVFASGRKSSVE